MIYERTTQEGEEICSYNLVFNEVPNNNDAARNIIVCLTNIGAQQFSMVAIIMIMIN